MALEAVLEQKLPDAVSEREAELFVALDLMDRQSEPDASLGLALSVCGGGARGLFHVCLFGDVARGLILAAFPPEGIT
jgi:hypothetical protein